MWVNGKFLGKFNREKKKWEIKEIVNENNFEGKYIPNFYSLK
jgi:hypothetical protein